MPILVEAMLTRAPVQVRGVSSADVSRQLIDLFSLKRLAVYPLWSGSGLAGVLVVDTHTDHVTFPADEIELVVQIADQAAVAIGQAQLHERAKAHAARADELYELTKQMTRTFDFDAVFARIVEAVTARTEADDVGLLEASGDRLSLVRTTHEVAEAAPRRDVPLEELPDGFWARLSRERTIRIDHVGRRPWPSSPTLVPSRCWSPATRTRRASASFWS